MAVTRDLHGEWEMYAKIYPKNLKVNTIWEI